MNQKSLLALSLAAAALLAGCDNNNRVSLSDVVQDAFAMTSETALPIEINSLDLDLSDESPTLYNGLLI